MAEAMGCIGSVTGRVPTLRILWAVSSRPNDVAYCNMRNTLRCSLYCTTDHLIQHSDPILITATTLEPERRRTQVRDTREPASICQGFPFPHYSSAARFYG